MSEATNEVDLKEAVYDYLDELRGSGVVNMFGAAPYLVEEFGFTKQEAKDWLASWMRKFSSRQ